MQRVGKIKGRWAAEAARSRAGQSAGLIGGFSIGGGKGLYSVVRDFENGLTDEQIMQLMGFDSLFAFDSWKNNSPEQYKLLQAANPGDIIRTTWSVNGHTVNRNWMIAYKGRVGGDLIFYDPDQRGIVSNGLLLTTGMFQGAGILRDTDSDGICIVRSSRTVNPVHAAQ